MSPRLRNLLIVTMVIPFIACLAGVAVTLPPPFPLQYQQAHQRWTQRGVRHYQVEVTWADGWSAGHARVEMRDNQFVRGVDLDTGQPLTTGKLLAASYF